MSFFAEGHTGVALFMILSGYIFLTLCRDRKINYLSFIRNRLLRITPLFIIWTLLYFYISDIDPAKLITAIGALLNNRTIPAVGWTVVVETQLYLLFPFLLVFFQKMGIRYLVGLVVMALAIRRGIWFIRGTVQDLAYSTIFGRIDQFLRGMIACEALRNCPKYFKSPIVLLTLIAILSFLYHRFDVLGGYFENKVYPSPSSIWVYLPTLEGLFYGMITAAYLWGCLTAPGSLGQSCCVARDTQLFAIPQPPLGHRDRHESTQGLEGRHDKFLDGNDVRLCGSFRNMLIMSISTYYLIEKPLLEMRKNT